MIMHETEDDDGLSTEREVIRLLTEGTYRGRPCVEQLYKAIDVLIDPDLYEAERRAFVIEAISWAWRGRLKGRALTQEEFQQVIGDIIRAVGDDRTHNLPKPPRRIRRTKQNATIITLH